MRLQFFNYNKTIIDKDEELVEFMNGFMKIEMLEYVGIILSFILYAIKLCIT